MIIEVSRDVGSRKVPRKDRVVRGLKKTVMVIHELWIIVLSHDKGGVSDPLHEFLLIPP